MTLTGSRLLIRPEGRDMADKCRGLQMRRRRIARTFLPFPRCAFQRMAGLSKEAIRKARSLMADSQCSSCRRVTRPSNGLHDLRKPAVAIRSFGSSCSIQRHRGRHRKNLTPAPPLLRELHHLNTSSPDLLEITPSAITAALAELFAGTAMSLFWSRLADNTMLLIVAFLLCVAPPAHAFAVGFGE